MAGLALSGCDRRGRARSTSGSLGEGDTPAPMGSTNIYRFAGVEQSLADARKAVQEERWDQAIAATDALLREQPNNNEARSLNHQARLELPNQQHYIEFIRAAGANEVATAMKQYRLIAEGSLYRDKARLPLEKLRAAYVDNQENEANALSRAGRCDDVRRVVRVTTEWFPDSRGRLDDAVASCRPAPAGVKTAELTLPKRVGFKDAVEPVALALPQPPAPAQAQPQEEKKEPVKAPEPEKLARTETASIAAPPPAPLAAAPAPAPTKPQLVPLTAIESQMIGGEKEIHLPPAILQVMSKKGIKQTTMVVKLCINASGAATSVDIAKSCGYAEADRNVVDRMHEWKFHPYMVNGQAVPVCAVKMFRYIIE
jgi:protein TonB